jgi:hypothetical protein
MALLRAHQTHKENCPAGVDGDLPGDSSRVPTRASRLPPTVISEAMRPAPLQTRNRRPRRFVSEIKAAPPTWEVSPYLFIYLINVERSREVIYGLQ